MIMKYKANFGFWELECIPAYGARISSLKYKGYELLITEPNNFAPPGK